MASPVGYQLYDDEPLLPEAALESYFRMHNPPWQDWGRYVRNSPIFYVDRVTTPLLMFHGELDGAAAQPEEFFTALYRQGKHAEYRRYLGEAM
jgi:dipeptidyl aminopeptidase/acylaminoacyl peptidase